MNIGIFLGHPAHFHMLKHAAKAWTANGHKVFFAIKQKDILEQLLRDAGFDYTIIREGRGKGKISMMLSVVKMEWRMCKFLRRNKIDVLIGTTLSFAARYIARKPVVVMNEDDAAVVPLYAKIVYPFASNILAPIVCNNGKWDTKSTSRTGIPPSESFYTRSEDCRSLRHRYLQTLFRHAISLPQCPPRLRHQRYQYRGGAAPHRHPRGFSLFPFY